LPAGVSFVPGLAYVPSPRKNAMARITIEDCTKIIPNRFHLVQTAAIRTKQLKRGAKALVECEDNKEVVVALREIAAGYITPDYPENTTAED
jgi:DNA-directed RNA polymerase omega subunit